MDPIFQPLFGDPAVAACLTDEARLQRLLDVEVALAESAAALGLIPTTAVAAIRACAVADAFDRAAIAREAARDGNLAIPLVRHLTKAVAARDAEAARYVHWGATSQDIIDTGLVLQLDVAVPLIGARLKDAADAAANLARQHIDVVMPGRTWLQQATPITVGLKAAGWLDALMRARARLLAAWGEARCVQLGGASGTLASVGERGVALMEDVATRLNLRVPEAPWHTHRDRLAHVAATLGIAAGSCGKIARDIALLSQTEIGEAREAPGAGRGGSSTMPHKQNPVSAATVIAAAVRAPGLVATMLQAMPQEHERGLGGWQAEWETLPELAMIVAGSARATHDMLASLIINPQRMRTNLDSTGGLLMAEAVSMALADRIGKAAAHGVIESASHRAMAESRPLRDVLESDLQVTAHLHEEDIARLLTPENYLGSARTFVQRILERHAHL